MDAREALPLENPYAWPAVVVSMSSPSDEYRSKSIREILESLTVQVYERPLSNLRDDLRSVPEVLRIPILIIDLDTEVAINGMLGFLENSTGLYLADTIDALETISAHKAAGTLRTIQGIMGDHGVTVERLRKDLEGAQLFQVTNFLELHGEERLPMAEEVDNEAKRLDIYDPAEPVFDLLEAYLQDRRDEFVAALNIASRQAGT
jgi:hypothetical protein